VLNDAVAIVLFHSFNQFKDRLAETDGTTEIGWRNSVVVQVSQLLVSSCFVHSDVLFRGDFWDLN
jgi:hypothetical protein